MSSTSRSSETLSHLTLPEAAEGRPDWGDRLYHSPIGLFEFQALGAARGYWQHAQSDERALLLLWDTGLGKTHEAMAEAAMLFEDGLLDIVVVVAESNKIRDWAQEDFPTFTRLTTRLYTGDPKKRQKILDDPPQVLVMTYETGRNDICTFRGKSNAVLADGMLTKALRGKRVLIVFDEFTKLGGKRSGKGNVAWDYLVNRALRREPGGLERTMVTGMTAGTVESSPENHYNACRILAPWRSMNVEAFYETYVAAWDQFGNPSDWKNLRRDASLEPGVTPLSEVWGPITLRKRKTDLDVIDEFPRKVENPPRFVPLSPKHAEFYAAVEGLLAEADEETQRMGFGLLRQVAGHPMSLLHSDGALAKEIVRMVTPEGLASMGAAKVDEMTAWAERLGTQQGVIFTFYGPSILPYLETALRQKGFTVASNHGGLSGDERQQAQRTYKAGDAQIFLSSDAGARGLNLGVGSALLHYDVPLLYSIFDQRSNRIHRIDSRHASVTIDSLVAGGADDWSTVEVAVAHKMLARNEWSDAVIDDGAYVEGVDPGEGVITAADRRAMMSRAKRLAA